MNILYTLDDAYLSIYVGEIIVKKNPLVIFQTFMRCQDIAVWLEFLLSFFFLFGDMIEILELLAKAACGLPLAETQQNGSSSC